MLRDPVEQTKEYMDAMKIISKEMDELPQWVSAAGCQAFKQRRLAEMGIRWITPAEMNRDIIFD